MHYDYLRYILLRVPYDGNQGDIAIHGMAGCSLNDKGDSKALLLAYDMLEHLAIKEYPEVEFHWVRGRTAYESVVPFQVGCYYVIMDIWASSLDERGMLNPQYAVDPYTIHMIKNFGSPPRPRG